MRGFVFFFFGLMWILKWWCWNGTDKNGSSVELLLYGLLEHQRFTAVILIRDKLFIRSLNVIGSFSCAYVLEDSIRSASCPSIVTYPFLTSNGSIVNIIPEIISIINIIISSSKFDFRIFGSKNIGRLMRHFSALQFYTFIPFLKLTFSKLVFLLSRSIKMFTLFSRYQIFATTFWWYWMVLIHFSGQPLRTKIILLLVPEVKRYTFLICTSLSGFSKYIYIL